MWSLFQGNQQNRINPYEAQIFWMALILCPVLWVVFFLIALFGLKFKWLVSTREETVEKFTYHMPLHCGPTTMSEVVLILQF